ncbi:MAG: maltose alpha-D-glucosyltransferase [Anaerolineae bacterium]|nr:maltose alpha-D-glucosyltransferase [Anaerolineae bacterium]
MSWYMDAIFYELYPRAFADGDGDGWGDFKGLLGRLDYLQWLGIDCIWITPFYPSPLRDDGYDVMDFTNIDPRYGALDDFQAVVDAAHARGIRVLVDLIMNHTSDRHPWFEEARSSRDNPKRDWYVWSDTDAKYGAARIIFLDTEPSNWAYDAATGQYYWHRFFSHQPDLNFDNPDVQAAMLDVVDFWLRFGIDGFRADAVPYLYEREGTNCENLPETHEYLKHVRRFVDARYPGRILLCEANQWPEDVRPYFGDGDEFHIGFHFPVMPRLYMAVRKGDRTDVIDILARTPAIPPGTQWCTFLRNHDELTLEMVTEEERQWMWQQYAPDPRMKLNLGIRRRLAPLMDNDRRKIELLNSLLFTLPGAPIIYYGDEIGMGDNIRLEDRNGVRTPMQWAADRPGAGFSTADPAQFYAPVIDDAVYGPPRVNVAAQREDPGSLLNTVRRLIAARKTTKALGRGELAFVLDPDKAVLAYTRACEGETVLALHNLGDAAIETNLPLAAYAGAEPQDLLDRARTWPPVEHEPYRAVLEPYEYVWLRLA